VLEGTIGRRAPLMIAFASARGGMLRGRAQPVYHCSSYGLGGVDDRQTTNDLELDARQPRTAIEGSGYPSRPEDPSKPTRTLGQPYREAMLQLPTCSPSGFAGTFRRATRELPSRKKGHSRRLLARPSEGHRGQRAKPPQRFLGGKPADRPDLARAMPQIPRGAAGALQNFAEQDSRTDEAGCSTTQAVFRSDARRAKSLLEAW
jgi:hypothetical protein